MKSKNIFGLMALFLLLPLVTIGNLSAQELKFDGYLNTGLGLVIDNHEEHEAYIKAYGLDADKQGLRFRLNGSYTNEAKTLGAKFRMQVQTRLDGQAGAGTNAAGYFSLPYAFGWVNFLKDIFTINGGIVEDNAWTTGDWWLASDSVSDFAGLGALLKITPLEGLVFGSGFYPINRRSGSNNNVLNISALGNGIKWYNVKYTLHAGYTLKDVFRIDLSWRTENKAGIDAANVNTATPESSKLYFDFRFLGLKPLTAVVAMSMDNLGENFTRAYPTSQNTANVMISETFGYKINDNLNIGLNGLQYLYNLKDASGNKVSVNPGLLFNLWGSYAFNKIVPRMDLVYFMGGSSRLVDRTTAIGDHNYGWDRIMGGFTNSPSRKDAEADKSLVSIRPSVKFNLDSKTFIEIGDMMNIDFGNFDGAYPVPGGPQNRSRFTNVLYVDFKWSF